MDTRIKILTEKMSIDEVKKLADIWYGTMIKGAVDVEGERVYPERIIFFGFGDGRKRDNYFCK